MHTIQLLLKTTEYDCQIIEKRFHAVSHVHNVLVKHAKKCLKRLNSDKEYLSKRAQYRTLLKKETLSKDERLLKKQLSDSLKVYLKRYDLSEYAFQAYIKICAAQFRKCLSSQQIQKEATRVWQGTQKVLFSNGRDIHFKKFRNFDTIGGKTNTNGVKFHKDTLSVEWLGLELKCKLPKEEQYIIEALDADISYCEIKRMMFSNGWHYYVIVYLKGDAPRKISKTGQADIITGADIGTSTVATVSDNKLTLKELAPKCEEYNKKIKKISRYLDNSKRVSNPNKYKPNGMIDKNNRDRWFFSNTYLKNANKQKTIYRKKAAYIKQSHESMINELLADSVNFIIEDMNFKGLQRRSKATKRQDTVSEIKQKDGEIKHIHKFKRKRRFGRSLNNRAPASFITILNRKAILYGGCVYKVNTKNFRASQYNHIEDNYVKMKLSDRCKYIGEHKVQRDLYSAFLLKNSNEELSGPDRDKCMYSFNKFLELQSNLINNMINNNVTMKQCFGF